MSQIILWKNVFPATRINFSNSSNVNALSTLEMGPDPTQLKHTFDPQ